MGTRIHGEILRQRTYPVGTMSTLPEKTQAAAREATDPDAQANQTDVYAVFGADPEVLAYAMAKYSRSSLSMKESLAEISSQRAEQFLNTFYFQYGHRSIADLAHVAFAIEKLSLLAAISLVDEQRWDGQERSTRYQNFRKSGWYTPALGDKTAEYTAAVEKLFHTYDGVSAGMLEALKKAIPKPDAMDEASYTRTLKARAFDVARYLLPMATNTSLGQIVNARTLETQVSRLLSSEFAEIRELGEKLKAAAAGPAWNVNHAEARVLLQEICSADSSNGLCSTRAEEFMLREVKTAPTLVKYASPNEYAMKTGAELAQAAAELMKGVAIAPAPVVDLVDDAESLEVELATSLLYPACHYSYRQLREHVAALSEQKRGEIIALGAKHRGKHDDLLRAFSSGHGFGFDILMDIGGFRDMHRHRKCVQLLQGYTDIHGYDLPDAPGQPTLEESGLSELYATAMESAFASYRKLAATPNNLSSRPELASFASAAEGPAAPNPEAAYLLPLGTRCRSLFKMDFAEALYIAELRSTVAGHYSYRRVAWEMFKAVEKRHPSLARYFRISDVNEPVDLLKR
jgi:thymidylate synthase ThyX